jgi:hypothetical protein
VSISDFFRHKKVVTETKEKSINRATITHITGGYAASCDLEDIYKGHDHNYDLAVGATNKQIMTVSKLVGTPVVKGASARLQRLLMDEYQCIITRTLVNGSHWVLPLLDVNGNIALEHIRDSTIGSGGLRINPVTGQIDTIVIVEDVQWLRGQFFTDITTAERKRIFTREKVLDIWTGGRNERIERENTLGITPIPFAFNSIGEWRGTSVYSGVLRIIRDMHEIRRNRDEILAKARPKAIVTSNNWDEWTNRNMIANGQVKTYDPFDAVVATNMPDEKFEFLALPNGVVADHNAALEDLNRELTISSMLPEIFSGRVIVGNHATAEHQITQAVSFIESVRREVRKATARLINNLAELDILPYEDLSFSFDVLDLTSPLTKSQILTNMAGALAGMLSSGTPVEIGFEILKGLNPTMEYKDAKELTDAARLARADLPAGLDDLADGAVPEWTV